MSAKDFRGADSKINACMWATIEYAARVKPLVAVFESVQLAAKEGEGRELMRALRARLEELTGERYHLYHVLHNAYSVGGAAMRRRYFWLASRVPFGIEEPLIQRYPTLNEVIGDLVEQPLTWEAQPYADETPSWWASTRRNVGSNGVPAHTVDGHAMAESPLHLRIKELIEWAEMRPREPIQNALKRCYERHGSLPPLWRHNQQKLIERDFFQGFTAPVRWDGEYPARVITGGALGCVIHPTLDRTITHRETARIMGFPDDWLIDPIPRGGLAPTWGKGITVDCGRWIGEWIKAALDGEPGTFSGDPVGERESVINCTNSWQSGGKIVIKSGKVVRATRKVSVTQGGKSMSEDVNVENTSEAGAPVEAPASNRRGRPRPEETIERDEVVLKVLEREPSTKVKIAEETGRRESEVYLSLHRLQKAGLIQRARTGGLHLWQVTAPADAEAEAAEAEVAAPAPDAIVVEPQGPAQSESWI
jgi:site-specific DNA-cytosine methylase/predicted transcriptional regulator